MSEPRFTPGPWEEEDGDITHSKSGFIICRMTTEDDFPCMDGGNEDMRQEQAANSALISASTRMYAALEKAKKQIRVFANTPSEAAVADAYCLEIDDLLVTARGELRGAK